MQRGCGVAVEVGEVPGKGYGVKARQEIKQGTYIGEYIGELYTALPPHLPASSLDYTLRFSEPPATPLYLVSARSGNFTRFINHDACHPNARLDLVRVDPGQPRVVLIAQKDIWLGEEITFDYGTQPGFQ